MVAGVAFVAPAQAASKDLAVGVTVDIDKFDPHTATSFSTIRVLGLTYGSLVENGPKLDIRSGLAASWGFNADSTELRLKLRKGVKFHDGSTFGAEDVVASINRILDPATKAAARTTLASITSVTGSGLSVLIKMSIPNAPILSALDGVTMSMLSSDDIAADKIGKTVNGTGPFKYVSWEPGQSIKLEKNASYWKAPVKLDTVTFRIIPTEASILAGLNAGTIQFSIITSPTVALQVGKNLNIAITCNPNSEAGKRSAHALDVDSGPELLAGSTRLKSGTAQKLVLNMISTVTMVRLGKTFGNLMVDLQISNEKLQDRAIRIIEKATGATRAASAAALTDSGHEVKVAILMLLLNIDANSAKERLSASQNRIRQALTDG